MNRLAARALDGFFPPRMPEPYVSPTRRGLVLALLLVTLAFFPGISVLSALSAIPDIVAGRVVQPVGDLSLGVVVTQGVGTLPALLLVWAFCWATGDRMSRLGLQWRPGREAARDSGWAFLWVYVVTGAASVGINIVVSIIPLGRRFTANVEEGGTLSLGRVALAGIALAIMAGVVEEIVVLGFSYRCLERLGLSDRTILVLLILLRLSYHVYYGVAVLSLLPWAWLSVVYYRRYRRLWPVIVGHALWDTWAFLSGTSNLVGLLGILAMALVCLVLAVMALVRWNRASRGPMPPQTPYRPVPQWQRRTPRSSPAGGSTR